MIRFKLPPHLAQLATRGRHVPFIFAYAARSHAKCRYKDWRTGALLMQWKTGQPVDLCVNNFLIGKPVQLEVYSTQDVFMFHFMLKGSALVHFPGRKKMKLHTDEFNLSLLPAGSSVPVTLPRGRHKSCFVFLKPEDVQVIGARYEPICELMAAFERGESQMQPAKIFAEITPALHDTLRRLERDSATPGVCYKRIYSAIFDIFTVYERAVQSYINRLQARASEQERASGVHQFILEHYHIAEQMSITALAEWADMSATALKKCFSEKYKKPIHQFITEIRLAEAELQLREGLSSATDIGYSVGYQTPAAFHTAFVKAYGMTPRAYRLMIQQKRGLSDF